ncbi:PilN domain-containing protein [Desulfosporosinus sp. OT]|uniref:PilN domain-containing protein n=1 Tax=Desulfosporosinus sp. OT TaxID=913865 RepID=UPI000223AD45|nr:PilN domain-containing protein [Desulfosporosinus sp. OT]EGW40343.1 fimbrial assembly family protein [Desulfosporosinus sp. OT]
MKDINLISQSQQQKKDRQNSGISLQLGIAFLVVLALGMVGYGILTFLEVRLAAKEMAIEQQIKAASPIVTVKKEIQGKQDKINQLSGIVDLVSARSTLNTRVLDGISSVMPENVFIVNYALDQTGNLNIIGKSKDMDSIAYFIAKLKGSGLFSNVYLGNVGGSTNSGNTDPNAETTEYNFAAILTLEK